MLFNDEPYLSRKKNPIQYFFCEMEIFSISRTTAESNVKKFTFFHTTFTNIFEYHRGGLFVYSSLVPFYICSQKKNTPQTLKLQFLFSHFLHVFKRFAFKFNLFILFITFRTFSRLIYFHTHTQYA